MKTVGEFLLAGAAVLNTLPACAHHSYAMFDQTKKLTVEGTVAKLEWVNPHIFVWVYVPNENKDGYDLYSFESGSPSILLRYGWTKTTLEPGEKITVEYLPLLDGRHGGAFIKATHADGSITTGDPHAPGAASNPAGASTPQETRPL